VCAVYGFCCVSFDKMIALHSMLLLSLDSVHVCIIDLTVRVQMRFFMSQSE